MSITYKHNPINVVWGHRLPEIEGMQESVLPATNAAKWKTSAVRAP
jgi:hypothetical protein